MLKQLLILPLGALFLMGASSGQIPAPTETPPARTAAQPPTRNLTDIFEAMLESGIAGADVVAHVEVTGYEPVKPDGDMTIYQVNARVIEQFKGPPVASVSFQQWIHETATGQAAKDENLVGLRVIVTLNKAPDEETYYVPEGGYTFPDDDNLLAVARKSAGQ